MNFYQKLSAYELGFLTNKDLPEIAMTGLEEGFDSESLCILAGYDSADSPFLLNDYFVRALKELGLTRKGRKEAVIDVISFYATNIISKEADPYSEFEKINRALGKTEFYWNDVGLMKCYCDYISIWEEKTDGLDFHTAEGLTKEAFIEKTKEDLRMHLQGWLNNGGT